MREMLLLTAFLLSFAVARAEETHVPRIAVLDLTSRDVSESELLMLSERLRVELVSAGGFQVLERERVESILKEQGFQMSPCSATECAIEVGQLIGADKMVSGSVGRVGSQYSIIIRLINVETGAIERTAVKDCRCQIEDLMMTTVRQAAGELAGSQSDTTRVVPPIGEVQSVQNLKGTIQGALYIAVGAAVIMAVIIAVSVLALQVL